MTGSVTSTRIANGLCVREAETAREIRDAHTTPPNRPAIAPRCVRTNEGEPGCEMIQAPHSARTEPPQREIRDAQHTRAA